MRKHFLILVSGFLLTAFVSYKAGLLNPSIVYLQGNAGHLSQNGNNSIHIEFTVVESYLKEIRTKVSQLEQEMKELKTWEAMNEQRTHLWKSLDVDTPSRGDLRNPHIMVNHVKLNCTSMVSSKYDLVILISSFAKHFERRQTIRATWGNSSHWKTRKQWKTIFVLGTVPDKETLIAIKKESKQYEDIILEDVPESFYQLSQKVMVGLQWVFVTVNFDFVLKADDDVFVNVDRMLTKLGGRLKKYHYIGSVMADQPVEREGRYALTSEEHPRDRFRPYCSGGGFLLSQRAIAKMLPHFNWKKPLKIDDAYIGRLVFDAGFKVHNEGGFYMWNTWCEYTEQLMISHPAKQRLCIDFLLQRAMIDNGLMKDTQNLTSQPYGLPPEQ